MHARTKPQSPEERVERWFAIRGWKLADFQRETMAAYRCGESGIVHAPTGSGKTLAAWLGPVSEAMQSSQPARGLQVLWITPLRALASDIHRNLGPCRALARWTPAVVE